MQEIKPMALKHVVDAFEASLAKNQKKAYGEHVLRDLRLIFS